MTAASVTPLYIAGSRRMQQNRVGANQRALMRHIADNPGCTATEACGGILGPASSVSSYVWNRTMNSVTRLRRRGLVDSPVPIRGKGRKPLHLTERGVAVLRIHEAFNA